MPHALAFTTHTESLDLEDLTRRLRYSVEMARLAGQPLPTDAKMSDLGDRWRAAGPIVSILCLQRVFTLLDGVTGPLLVAYNYVRALFIVQLATAIASVALLTAMAKYGVSFAAFSSVLAAAASTTACFIIAARNFPGLLAGIPRVLPVAVFPALATGIAAFVCAKLLPPAGADVLLSVAVEVAAGAAAFGVTAFVLRNEVMHALHALNHPAPTRAFSSYSAELARPDDDGAPLLSSP